MKEYFSDKVVFITGSSKGIGKATAVLLGSWGAKVALNGRNVEALENTRNELSGKGINCIAIAGDISDSKACLEMINRIVSEYGRLDILINNAGIATHGKIRELTTDAWSKAIGINTLGSVYTTHHALPHLLKSAGHVVFISTLAGKLGMPGHSTYSVSKMGLTALAKAMQIEFSPEELHTAIVYVGFTENEENKQILHPDGTYRRIPKRKQKTSSREEVAMSIAKTIYKKRKAITLTTIGKLQAFALRFMPFVINIILRKANRDYSEMYN